MRLLITGAQGFIGSHLVARLAGEHEIVALVRRLLGGPRPGVTYVVQDLAEPLDTARLPAQIDAIIHQAALIDADAPGQATTAFLVNVVAVWGLLDYARRAGARLFVHASTGGVYGCRDRPFVEADPPNPMDLYSLTKAQAELAVRHAELPFPRVILRYFFPYGAGTPNPIPAYVRRAVLGEPIQITPSRKPRLNPIHIADAVEATVRCLALAESMTLNIAGVETTTFAAIAELAAAHAARVPRFEAVPADAVIPYYRADLVADTRAMQRTLHFTPTIRLSTGIAELASATMSDSRRGSVIV